MPFRPTWLESDRHSARTVGRPLAAFLQVEAAGGLVLLVATIAALVWANSPWEASYTSFWHTRGHGPGRPVEGSRATCCMW